MIDIGRNISILRKASGLNQKELGRLAGIGPASMCLYESNKREPSVSIVLAIADALHVPRSVMFVEFGEKPLELSKFQSEEWDYLQGLFAQVLGTLILRQK